MERKILPSNEQHKISTLENGAKVYGISEGYINESGYHRNFNYNEITLIGEFSIDYSEEDLVLEDRKIADIIKYGKKTLNYQIYVYGKEGPTPHFHIIETGEDDREKKIDCCICIFEANFFDHGAHTDLLNNKELKILNNFLKSKIGVNTYWEIIVAEWHRLNPGNYNKYSQNRKTNTQPDYSRTNSIVAESYY